MRAGISHRRVSRLLGVVLWAVAVTAQAEPSELDVRCELQPGAEQEPYGYHTSEYGLQDFYDYWYEVTPSASLEVNAFRVFPAVQYDGYPDQFFNWYQPEGWDHWLTIRSNCWVVCWTNVAGAPLPCGTSTVFGFDHRAEGVWGRWETDVATCEDYDSRSNGFGYLVHVPGPQRSGPLTTYASPGGSNCFPYDTFENAATSVEAAVEAAGDGATVYVDDGTYVLQREIQLYYGMRLVGTGDGPEDVALDGQQTTRCIRLIGSSVVEKVTVRNGWADRGAAILGVTTSGVPEGWVVNCVIQSNTWGGGLYNVCAGECLIVNNSTYWGGGANESRLYNCTLRGNSARFDGGGAYYSTLYNCTLSGNSAGYNGGGVSGCMLYNCIVWYNTATNSGDDIYDSAVYYTCSPDVTNGVDGCITNEPCFVELAATNLHLRSDSPCIDAGMVVSLEKDLEGVPRPLDGDGDGTAAYDMGCYEYLKADADSDGDGIPDGWEERYGLSLTDAADGVEDADGDGMDNRGEYVADTVPTNAMSCFRITELEYGHSCRLSFACTNTRVYGLERTTGLATGEWEALAGQTNVAGADSGEMTLEDSNTALAAGAYRVWVRLP